jgi:hypothetical protein
MPPHCASDGPAVTAGRQALEARDVDLVLPFVPGEGEDEVRTTFARVLPLRTPTPHSGRRGGTRTAATTALQPANRSWDPLLLPQAQPRHANRSWDPLLQGSPLLSPRTGDAGDQPTAAGWR